MNQGDDIAGTVYSVGDDVTEFKPGDRVAAFHEMMTPGGSYAEYAVAHEHTTFHIPESTSYDEAATIPLAAMTSALGLFQILKLPVPWVKKTPEQKTQTPVLVYGAATAVGAFAIKFLKVAQIGPVIGIAGRGKSYVESLLDTSNGDAVVDYRDGHEAIVKGITSALQGKKLHYAFDTVSEKDKGSYQSIWSVLDHQTGYFTTVLPLSDAKEVGIPDSAYTRTSVGSAHSDNTEPGDKFFAYAMYRFIARGLRDGWFKGHPYEVVPGGLGGVEKALTDLKAGKASAVKYVIRISETQGLEDQEKS